MEYSYRIEYLFTGLNIEKLALLKQLRALAHAVLVLLLIRIKLGANISKEYDLILFFLIKLHNFHHYNLLRFIWVYGRFKLFYFVYQMLRV